jgi:hypothetical protein
MPACSPATVKLAWWGLSKSCELRVGRVKAEHEARPTLRCQDQHGPGPSFGTDEAGRSAQFVSGPSRPVQGAWRCIERKSQCLGLLDESHPLHLASRVVAHRTRSLRCAQQAPSPVTANSPRFRPHHGPPWPSGPCSTCLVPPSAACLAFTVGGVSAGSVPHPCVHLTWVKVCIPRALSIKFSRT